MLMLQAIRKGIIVAILCEAPVCPASETIAVETAQICGAQKHRRDRGSVKEVAGEQHREDANQQQAPVQGGSVQLDWQHGIVGAWLRQSLQHHRGVNCGDLHSVASEGTLATQGRGLDNEDLLLRAGDACGEEPNAGGGGQNEERRSAGHSANRGLGLRDSTIYAGRSHRDGPRWQGDQPGASLSARIADPILHPSRHVEARANVQEEGPWRWPWRLRAWWQGPWEGLGSTGAHSCGCNAKVRF